MRENKTPQPAHSIQRMVDNSRASIGRRIVITDRHADDFRATGIIRRYSQYRNYFAVEFDNDPGEYYRVHYRDMDYTGGAPLPATLPAPPAPAPVTTTATPSAADADWEIIGDGKAYQNCAHFALQDDFLAIEQDVREIAAQAHTVGLVRTTDASKATVLFYGSGNYYSHAIRKVEGVWQEVQYIGGPLRRYIGSQDPPLTNQKDGVVLMLMPASA